MVLFVFDGDTDTGDSPLLGSVGRDFAASGVSGTLSAIAIPACVLDRPLGRVTSVGVGPTLARFAGDGGPPALVLAGEANVDMGGG